MIDLYSGILMSIVGLLMLVAGTVKTEFVVYRLMVARSRLMWGKGDSVHRFYQGCGLIIVILGLL